MASGRSLDNSIELLRQLSKQSSDGGDIPLQEELELLQNVYFEDIEIVSMDPCTLLKLHITPSTADNKDKQFVYLDIYFKLDKKYPFSKPEITIAQSRGLSDAHIDSIIDGVSHLATEQLGLPMIFNLVEHIRDCLTNNNRPCGKCAFCQYEFQEDEEFVRTECYHYFHPDCLLKYTKYFNKETIEKEKEEKQSGVKKRIKRQLECPVCRVTIHDQDSCLLIIESVSVPDYEDVMPFQPDSSLLSWQYEMSRLYEKQLNQGGIINLSELDDVIDDTWVSLRNQESSNPRDTEDALTEDTRNIHIEDSTDTKPRGNNDISIQKNGDTLVQKEESFPDRDRSNETSTSKQQESKTKAQNSREHTKFYYKPHMSRNSHRGRGQNERYYFRHDRGGRDHYGHGKYFHNYDYSSHYGDSWHGNGKPRQDRQRKPNDTTHSDRGYVYMQDRETGRDRGTRSRGEGYRRKEHERDGNWKRGEKTRSQTTKKEESDVTDQLKHQIKTEMKKDSQKESNKKFGSEVHEYGNASQNV